MRTAEGPFECHLLQRCFPCTWDHTQVSCLPIVHKATCGHEYTHPDLKLTSTPGLLPVCAALSGALPFSASVGLGFFVLGAVFETVSLYTPSCPEVSLPACTTTTTQSCEVSPNLAYFLLEHCRLICKCTRGCLCRAVCDTGPRASVPWSGLSRAWSSSFKDYSSGGYCDHR